MAFSYEDVKQAYERIEGLVCKTPLEESFYLGDGTRRYFFKLESFQKVKSFKIRGALNNHGCSVSYAAALLGIQNTKVIVPQTAPKSKVDRIRYFGAEVMQLGRDYDEAHALGMAYIEEHGLTYIDPYYDDPKIYGGQGTIAIEILEQNPDIDTIVVPIGGGGLITGIAVAAKAIKPDIRIVGVQTEACPAMIRSYADGVFYEEYPTTGETVCDALVGGVGKLSYELLKDYADDLIAVKEETIRRAVRHMIMEEKFVVEGASATTVAAVMENQERIGGKNIALVMSGGNIDGQLIAQLLQ